MIWHKTNPAPKVFKAGFLNSCEMIFTCWNKKHTWNFISQADMHNFIQSPICMPPERLKDPKHPAQKPISILKKMLEIASNKDDIIFDPFMGVGSTGVAALELDRRFVGVEIDEAYFNAAKKRIEETLYNNINQGNMYKTLNLSEDGETMNVSDSNVAYQTSFFELEEFFHPESRMAIVANNYTTGLQPLLKWPGGKEKELKYILPNSPTFKRYFEPFVGGGSVFMAFKAKEYYINDFSTELISLYNNIATSNENFFWYAELMDTSWKNAVEFFQNNRILVDKYIEYREGKITKVDLHTFIHEFCKSKKDEIKAILGKELSSFPSIIHKEMKTNLFRKMERMHKLEIEKHILPEKDLDDNIETAIKSAVYMNYRYLYNDKNIADSLPTFHCALFFFMRNYAYSGMFRYSSKGEFNVPYGGIGYNSKLMAKKLNYYKSKPLLDHFANAKIYNLDFEEFLRTTNPTEDDFVFLDPPYDSEFSTYAQNAFTKEDQERLANYMINECRAKWMLIIKNTDFIYNLYNKEGINIRTFDKEYLVSFMNRNDKKVTHLLITNY